MTEFAIYGDLEHDCFVRTSTGFTDGHILGEALLGCEFNGMPHNGCYILDYHQSEWVMLPRGWFLI